MSHCYVKLFNRTIMNLANNGGPSFILYDNYLVTQCEIVGYIVSVDMWANKATVMGK